MTPTPQEAPRWHVTYDNGQPYLCGCADDKHETPWWRQAPDTASKAQAILAGEIADLRDENRKLKTAAVHAERMALDAQRYLNFAGPLPSEAVYAAMLEAKARLEDTLLAYRQSQGETK